jgi:hypothetical protein
LPRSELVARLRTQGIEAVPLSDAEDLWFDPALRERSVHFFATRRSAGTLPYARSLPLRWNGRCLQGSRRSIPTLGEHNWEVLGTELGITASTLARLEQEGIAGTRPSGHLPRTFAVPLDLSGLAASGLIRPVADARQHLIASFSGSGTQNR